MDDECVIWLPNLAVYDSVVSQNDVFLVKWVPFVIGP